MIETPPLAGIVAALPPTIPFVAPEAIERRTGRALTLRLGANESLFGPAPGVIEAVRRAASEMPLYGDPDSVDLREKLAALHSVGADHIVVGCGIDELLGLLVQAYLEPGEAVVMSRGSYPTFAFHVAGHGGRLATVPYRQDRNDAMALADTARREGAKLVYLANPDNPSGSWLDAASQTALLDALPTGALLLLDEAYANFAPRGAVAEIAPGDPRVVRLRTFSKAHGLAGMRVGYALGAPELVRPLDRIRNHFGVGRLAQVAAEAALADPDYTARVVAAVAAGREEYRLVAEALGCLVLPSATNFVAIDMGGSARAKATLQAMLEREGVFIRMPGAPPLDRCIRVTVGRPEDRAHFAEAFRRVISAGV